MRLQTATTEPIHLYGFKSVYLLVGIVDLWARFYIAEVHQPILGLRDIMTTGVIFHNRSQLSSMIIKNGKEKLLQYLHRHLWAEATALPIDHNINATWIFYIETLSVSASTTSNSLQMSLITSLTWSTQMKPEHQHQRRYHRYPHLREIDQHSLTHQTCRSWRPIRQRARGRPGHHRRRTPQDQPKSLIQMHYAYVNQLSS